MRGGSVRSWLLIFFIFLPLFLAASSMKKLTCESDGLFSQSELYDALGLQQPTWYQFWKDKRAKINPKLTTSFTLKITFYLFDKGRCSLFDSKEDSGIGLLFLNSCMVEPLCFVEVL